MVFYDLAQQVAFETIAFEAGECVAYAEQFAAGASGDGAYTCHRPVAELPTNGCEAARSARCWLANGPAGRRQNRYCQGELRVEAFYGGIIGLLLSFALLVYAI